MSLLSNTTRQKVGNCLPEIKKEISRKGSSKSAEKVLQINQEKIRNQAVNEKALLPNLSGVGFRYKLGCATRSLIHGCRRRELRPERVNLVEAFLFYRLSTSSAERTCKLGLK